MGAFTHRNFRLYFAGQVVSLVGTWMQNIAQSWLVYRLTGSSAMLGLVGFVSQIPVLMLTPVGGNLADRWNRRRLLVATQGVSLFLAFILALLTLTGWIRVWQIPVLAVLLGIVNAFDMPTRQSFVVEMVGKTDLHQAIAYNATAFNAARLIGPAVAGVLVAWIGEGWCFFVNGVSFLAVIASLLAMRMPPWKPPKHSRNDWSEALQGFHYVRQTLRVRAVVVLLAVSSVMGTFFMVLMPVISCDILHGDSRTQGILMASSGLGALLSALQLTRVHGAPDPDFIERRIAWSSICFGLCLAAFAFSRNLHLSMLLLVGVGFCMVGMVARVNTLLQTLVPDHLRGRVMAIHAMAFLGMTPFGALLSGAAAQRLGVPLTIFLGALATTAAGVWYWSGRTRSCT
ncbi:MAG TPA: MFS transporter [Fibrobacteraceae bacterium]|nr:MFS transporter [Fibrobacteraceae bacterium]